MPSPTTGLLPGLTGTPSLFFPALPSLSLFLSVSLARVDESPRSVARKQSQDKLTSPHPVLLTTQFVDFLLPVFISSWSRPVRGPSYRTPPTGQVRLNNPTNSNVRTSNSTLGLGRVIDWAS